MADVFALILGGLGVLLLGVGIGVLVGRRRLAKNLAAANAVPARVESSVGYVVGLGVLQVGLGILSLVASGVMANRGAFAVFARAVDRTLEVAGLNVTGTGIFALLAGLAAVVVGGLTLRRAWRSRSDWGDSRSEVSLPPEGSRLIVAGTLLCALGTIATAFGAFVLAGGILG